MSLKGSHKTVGLQRRIENETDFRGVVDCTSPGLNSISPGFGATTAMFDDTRPMFDNAEQMFDDTRPMFDSTGRIFDDTHPMFDSTSRMFDDTRQMFDDTRQMFDDTRQMFDDTRQMFDDIGAVQVAFAQVFEEIPVFGQFDPHPSVAEVEVGPESSTPCLATGLEQARIEVQMLEVKKTLSRPPGNGAPERTDLEGAAAASRHVQLAGT